MSGLVAPLDPYELKKFRGKKFERKKVRLFRRFKLFSARTFLLDSLQPQLVYLISKHPRAPEMPKRSIFFLSPDTSFAYQFFFDISHHSTMHSSNTFLSVAHYITLWNKETE